MADTTATQDAGLVISKPTKADLRATIFATKKPKKTTLTFFGAEIELRQPLLSDVIEAQANPNRTAAVIDTLTRYAYVPGTDEHVFDEADADELKNMPFGDDFVRVSQALEKLTSADFLGSSTSVTS